MALYVRRPHEVDAIQYRSRDPALREFLKGFRFRETSACIHIDLGGASCSACPGDWLVKAHNFITVMETENFIRAFMPKDPERKEQGKSDPNGEAR